MRRKLRVLYGMLMGGMLVQLLVTGGVLGAGLAQSPPIYTCEGLTGEWTPENKEWIGPGAGHTVIFEPERPGIHKLEFASESIASEYIARLRVYGVKVTPYWSEDGGEHWNSWGNYYIRLLSWGPKEIPLITGSDDIIYRFDFEDKGLNFAGAGYVTYSFYCDDPPVVEPEPPPPPPEEPEPEEPEPVIVADHQYDTRAAAYHVALGSTTNATPISPADDQDWYKFTLDRESSVVIQTNSDNTVKNGDTHIYLYRDGSNRVLDENDDISLSRTRSSRLRFDCANSLDAGTYYVKVTSFQSEYEVGWYTLNVNASACSTSDGDSQSSAPGGYVQLVVQHSNKCLDVSNLSQDNGAKIQQWTCHGRDNQLWELRRVGNYHQIIAKHSGKCLAVRGTSPGNGNVLQQWTCDARQNNQLWQFIEVGDDYRLVAKHSGQCMDVSDVGYDNGAQLIQWDCHSGENQLWHVYPGNVTPPPPHSSGSATQTDDPPPEGQTTVLRHYAPNTHSYCGGETDIIQLAIQPIVDRSRLWIYVKKCDGGTFAKNGQYYIRVDGDRRFGPYQYRAGDLLSRQDITPPSPSTGDHRYTIELYPVGQSYPINSGAVVVEGRVEYE